jgi:hypothetical protein
MDPVQTIKHALEVNGYEYQVEVVRYADGILVVNAESITEYGAVDLIEELIEGPEPLTVQDIEDAIDAENERRYDVYIEGLMNP